ncbi:M20 family metallopeptidase [Alkaliphilus peptidifermentans]|uniref:Probable succinyl-diaminopimelate desuccinylase n=1 Tax=Alkaliphilus peptidifermentans DSM 18978 TaxID=1120976 RepID=A0A1G5JS41_9FIRM|nr:M20 family metallopeptidase [Alkaliphilus peptidifermentans]SCY91157.1 succinyl-diaminopimelate desuccinylase [Alkaliphilus peptidifermentans DSM 18978]
MKNIEMDSIRAVISQDEVVSIIKDMVKIPSYPGIVNQETKVAEYIHSLFLKEGIDSELHHVVDGRCNIVAKLKGNGGGKSLLLTGHIDTVPPYDMEEDPFEIKIIDGKMIGRGVVDMKGPLACMISAIIAIKRANLQLKGDIIFAGVIDEEEKSEGTINFIERNMKVDGAIVGEPTSLNVCVAHRGLEWLEFYFKGKTVHGGKQKDGINAIVRASRFIQKCEEKLITKIEAETHPIIGCSSMNYGAIKGGTQPSTVAGECTLQIDRRWVPGKKYNDIMDEYQEIIEELKSEDPLFNCSFKVMDVSAMRKGYIHEALETDTNHPLVKIARNATMDIYKKESEITFFTAWTDGGLLSSYAGIPTVIFAPGDLETAHSAIEYLNIHEVLPATLIYASIALEFCN